jgi:hypothetical protein
MSSKSKGWWSRGSATVILGLTAVYVVQIVRGKVPGEHRLGTNDTIVIALASVACVLLLRPEIFGRISRVELPGIKVDLEKVLEQQEKQAHELESIQLIMPLLLPDKERVHLRNLADGNCKEYKGSGELRRELRRLRSIALIRAKGSHTVHQMSDGLTFDLSDYMELTDSGLLWVQRLAEWQSGEIADGGPAK